MKRFAWLVSLSLLASMASMPTADAVEEEISFVYHQIDPVCAGPTGFSGGVSVAVGDVTGVLACDPANRHVRHRFFAIVDRTTLWRVDMLVVGTDGATRTCDFTGAGALDPALSCGGPHTGTATVIFSHRSR